MANVPRFLDPEWITDITNRLIRGDIRGTKDDLTNRLSAFNSNELKILIKAKLIELNREDLFNSVDNVVTENRGGRSKKRKSKKRKKSKRM
jgi:hypothetical protein